MTNDYGGEHLLAKWLSGDITYNEELELFELAAADPVLQEALEGYIGQNHIVPAELPVTVVKELYPERSVRKPRKIRSMVFLSYVAAALALLVALTFAITITNNKGMIAEPVVADFEDIDMDGDAEKAVADVQPEAAEDLTAEVLDDAVEEQTERVAMEAIAAVDNDRSAADEGNEQKKGETVVDNAVAQVEETVDAIEPYTEEIADASVDAQDEGSLLPDGGSDLSEDDGSGSFLADEASTGKEGTATPEVEAEIALQFFDYEADEVLKREVQLEAIKEGDEPITGYEIDVKTGISPEELTGDALVADEDKSSDIDQVGLQSKANLTDAAGVNATETETNMIANNVVITEYKIQKRDITHPPVEDYNSLVREKYKRKAKPEIGFYHYKKYLKRATNCLVDEYSDAAYLEEAIIKFRVYGNGSIEFIELFGAGGSSCIDQISADITSGPKWEVAEHYESIDIEVPFKVLYPYWY